MVTKNNKWPYGKKKSLSRNRVWVEAIIKKNSSYIVCIVRTIMEVNTSFLKKLLLVVTLLPPLDN
jgi:hypothetical protein